LDNSSSRHFLPSSLGYSYIFFEVLIFFSRDIFALCFYALYFIGTLIYSIFGVYWVYDSECGDTRYGSIALFSLISFFIVLAFLLLSIGLTVLYRFVTLKKDDNEDMVKQNKKQADSTIPPVKGDEEMKKVEEKKTERSQEEEKEEEEEVNDQPNTEKEDEESWQNL